jgi:hypothetical protein
MNQRKKISSYHSLHVVIETQAGENLITHLKKTVLGTPGGLRYMHTDQEKKLKNIGEAYFILLYKSEQLLGSVGLCCRLSQTEQRTDLIWYIRYFAIHAPLRAKTSRKKLITIVSDSGLGILKRAVLPYFENPGLLKDQDSTPASKSLILAVIDKKNPRSMDFAMEMGFEIVRTFNTIICTSFRPKFKKNVRKVRMEEKPHVLGEIEKFYATFSLFLKDNIFLEDNYFVAVENGEIIGGLQANPETWKIVDMSGLFGCLIRTIPKIPFIGNIINPNQLRFIGVEAIWYKKGRLDIVSDLIESALSYHKRNVALTWVDAGSFLKLELEKKLNRGFPGRFLNTGDGNVLLKFVHFKESEKEPYYKKSAYLSAFDMT